MLKLLLALPLSLISVAVFAHKPGFYQIDEKENVSVLFSVIEMCPVKEGALEGKLRTFNFSLAAEQEPYSYQSGFYVEIHTEAGDEIYVKTDIDCVPVERNGEGVKLPATRTELAGYSIKRIRGANE